MLNYCKNNKLILFFGVLIVLFICFMLYESNIAFLNTTLFQSTIILFSILVTYAIYKNQQDDNIYNIAKLIILEIESIEKNIDLILKSTNHELIVSSEQLFQTIPIYQKLDWIQYRGLLASKLDIEHIRAISNFYEGVILFEEARLLYRNLILKNRESKAEYIQSAIATMTINKVKEFYELSSENKNNISIANLYNDISTILNKYTEVYNEYSNNFIPKGHTWYFEKAKKSYQPISNTPAYVALRKVSKNNV